MKSLLHDYSQYPFPQVSDSLKRKYAAQDLFLHPFGLQKADLTLDFKRSRNFVLSCAVLKNCTATSEGRQIEKDFFLELPICKRIEGLLVIVTKNGASFLELQVKCKNETCGELMEAVFSKEEILNLRSSSDAEDTMRISYSDKEFVLRKPTGQDQLKWLNSSFYDEDETIFSMISTLLTPQSQKNLKSLKTEPDEYIRQISNNMSSFDPLVDFSINLCCPLCKEVNAYNLQLEDILLRILQGKQEQLFNCIHVLASHYHWSEDEILAIGEIRRNYYLEMIEREKSRGLFSSFDAVDKSRL